MQCLATVILRGARQLLEVLEVYVELVVAVVDDEEALVVSKQLNVPDAMAERQLELVERTMLLSQGRNMCSVKLHSLPVLGRETKRMDRIFDRRIQTTLCTSVYSIDCRGESARERPTDANMTNRND